MPQKSGVCGIGHRTTCALSVPLKCVKLGGTTVFSELHGTVRHIFLQTWLYLVCMTIPCLHKRRDLNFWGWSIWILNKMSEVGTRHIKSAHGTTFMSFECQLQVRGVSAPLLVQVTWPGCVTLVKRVYFLKEEDEAYILSLHWTYCLVLKAIIFRHKYSTYRDIL